MITKLICSCALVCSTQLSATALATSKAKPLTIEQRVSTAKLVFVGKIVEKRVKGDWVEAKIVVEKAIRGVKKGQKIPVTWRTSLHGKPLYNVAEGKRGIAILQDKHNGKYWLRADKFETLKLENQVIKASKLRKTKHTKATSIYRPEY